VDLASQRCVPCGGGVPGLGPARIDSLLEELGQGWSVVDGRLEREYRFPDFATALAFTNEVGAIAESEGHHPDILLGWGRVRIRLWTHASDGLTENDFILAAKISEHARS